MEIQIEFLTPTDTDQFVEEKLAERVHNITLDKSIFRVKVEKASTGISFSVIEQHFESTWHQKKLYGYVLFKVITAYN